MKEWIGYYEDVLTSELSENIALNSKGWPTTQMKKV